MEISNIPNYANDIPLAIEHFKFAYHLPSYKKTLSSMQKPLSFPVSNAHCINWIVIV
jgi:hypothetical protein